MKLWFVQKATVVLLYTLNELVSQHLLLQHNLDENPCTMLPETPICIFCVSCVIIMSMVDSKSII